MEPIITTVVAVVVRAIRQAAQQETEESAVAVAEGTKQTVVEELEEVQQETLAQTEEVPLTPQEVREEQTRVEVVVQERTKLVMAEMVVRVLPLSATSQQMLLV
jgi:hypothetical protein